MNGCEIREMIRAAGLSEDLFFVGVGETYSNKGNGKKQRYEFDASKSKNIDTQEYAIKYFSALDRYFVWKRAHKVPAERNRTVKRTLFSIKRETIETLSREIRAKKRVEFQRANYPEEVVLVLTRDGLEEHLHELSKKM